MSEQKCLRCRRMAISMVTAYQLTSNWQSTVMTGNMVLTESMPIEDLVDPTVPSTAVRDINLAAISDPELRAFLEQPQAGPREIAKRIFRLVAHRRAAGFSAAAPEFVAVAGAPVFPEVPEDSGHFPGRYYRHVLQGLRASVPPYVEQLRREAQEPVPPALPTGTMGRAIATPSPSGRRRPAELQDTNIAGVVLVTL